MNFSIALIAKNEEKTLPRLLDSLKEFQDRGGEIVLLDTGSTDKTAEVARARGVTVEEVGDKFITTLEQTMVDLLNTKFVVGQDEPIAKVGDRIFDYSAARNYIAAKAKNDMLSMPDCDEVFTKLDLDEVTKAIDDGVTQLEYNFVFSHDQFGSDAIKFMHSKFYNRTVLEWTGVVHEVLKPLAVEKTETVDGEEITHMVTAKENKRLFLDETKIKLEHFQNTETNRSHYLTGLVLDCYLHPDNDRNSHYLGRELMYTGRFQSAIKELMRHMNLSKWRPEISQSMIFIGDCQRSLGRRATAVECYHQAFQIESGRREPLMRLAEHYFQESDALRVAVYARAALEIPQGNFYADLQGHYQNLPHELLYWAYWQLDRKEDSKKEFDLAFQWQPLNSKYLHDVRFYRELPHVSFLIPTLGRPEGLKKCLDSIKAINYPEDLIEVITQEDNPRIGVPKLVNKLFEQSKGQYLVYASNDTEFTPDSLIIAVLMAMDLKKGLVAFNTGPLSPDHGNINEHFLISRQLVQHFGGEIFDPEFNHVGVDNLLWAKAHKEGQEIRADHAHVVHNHWSKTGAEKDDVYKLGWDEEKVKADRELLAKKLAELN